MSENAPMIDPGLASGFAAFESRDFTQAMRLLLQFAESGNADAQHKVAIMFQNGLGVVSNDDNAFKYMKLSAEQGDAIAEHGLGFMYMEGECVPQDFEQALVWFKKAAAQDMLGSMTTIAMMY
ncbi:hypothetical protein MNBD_GAMMA10-1090, partial [hydrothermal vent metagenome]